jgi:hypothetical protein
MRTPSINTSVGSIADALGSDCSQFTNFLLLADQDVNKTGGHEYNSPDNSGHGGYDHPESECDRTSINVPLI